MDTKNKDAFIGVSIVRERVGIKQNDLDNENMLVIAHRNKMSWKR